MMKSLFADTNAGETMLLSFANEYDNHSFLYF